MKNQKSIFVFGPSVRLGLTYYVLRCTHLWFRAFGLKWTSLAAKCPGSRYSLSACGIRLRPPPLRAYPAPAMPRLLPLRIRDRAARALIGSNGRGPFSCRSAPPPRLKHPQPLAQASCSEKQRGPGEYQHMHLANTARLRHRILNERVF